MVSPYSSSLWNCWFKLALRHYVNTQICSILGRKFFGKILPWLVGLPSQAHSAPQQADTESDRHCETERVWLARVSHGTQDVLFVIRWPPALLCLCATQNVSPFGSSRSVKLSHLLSGEPQCVWLYVVVSLCLCKKKMSNPSTTTCQDVTPFYFVKWHSLCVSLYVLCAFGSLYAIHSVPYPSASACQDFRSFRCQIFRQVTYCVCDCIFIVCNWVLVLVKVSHPSAAACPIFHQVAHCVSNCMSRV